MIYFALVLLVYQEEEVDDTKDDEKKWLKEPLIYLFSFIKSLTRTRWNINEAKRIHETMTSYPLLGYTSFIDNSLRIFYVHTESKIWIIFKTYFQINWFSKSPLKKEAFF